MGKSAWKIFIQRGRDLDEEANYRQLLERMSKSEKMTIYPLIIFLSQIGKRKNRIPWPARRRARRILHLGRNKHENFRTNDQTKQGNIKTRIFAFQCKFLDTKMR